MVSIVQSVQWKLMSSQKPENMDPIFVEPKSEQWDLKEPENWEWSETVTSIKANPRIILKFTATPMQWYPWAFTIAQVKQQDLNTPIEAEWYIFQAKIPPE